MDLLEILPNYLMGYRDIDLKLLKKDESYGRYATDAQK